MRKLFLQILLGFLLLLILSHLIIGQLIRKEFQRVREDGSVQFGEHPPEHRETALLKVLLDKTPAEELPVQIERLRAIIHSPIRLCGSDDESIPRDVRARISADQAIVRGFKDKPDIFIPIHNGKWLVIMSPHFQPKPPGKFFPINFAIMLSIVIPVIAVISFILAYPMISRLRRLEQAAIKIGEGDLTARVELTSSSDAVGTLALRFNQMADKIQLLLENQRYLLQAVSHELRTPISRIGFNLEMLSVAKDDQEMARRIQEIDEEITELNQLVNELLLFTRFDAHPAPAKMQLIELPGALQDLTERLKGARPEIAVDIRIDAEDKLEVCAHPVYFKRAVQNLLSNAIRYAQSSVAVRCHRGANGVFIDICDDGPGITPPAREIIFEPFARIDDSRSRESGGVGLGLAIVRRIVEFHGGSIVVTDNDGGGSCFITFWPDKK